MMLFIVLFVRCSYAFQARALVEEEPQIPLFDITPSNITAIAGETAILPCAVDRKGDHKIIWVNPRKTVISREDSRYIDDSRMSVERPKMKDWNLMIREVRYNDSGEYMCQINMHQVQIKRVYLFVKVPPEILEDWTNTNLEVIEGARVELVCNATGVPMPVVTWYKQSSLLKGSDQDDGGEESTLIGEVLILHNITRYCDGVYECYAENGVLPMATRKFQITVLFPPEVQLPTRRMGQSIGKETILQCTVSASPHESIVWTKNGSALPLHMYKYWTELYDEGHHEKTLHLNIIDIDQDDFGYYTCHASNNLGRDSETMLLYEYKIVSVPKQRITTAPWRPSPLTTVQQYYHDKAIITPPFVMGGQQHNVGHHWEKVGSVYFNDTSKAVSSLKFCDALLLVTLTHQLLYQILFVG